MQLVSTSTPQYALAAAGAASLASALTSINATMPLVQQLHDLAFEEFDRVELQARSQTGAASTAIRTGADLLQQALPDQSALADRLRVHGNSLAEATNILARHDSIPDLTRYTSAVADVSVAHALLGALSNPYPYAETSRPPAA